MTELVLTLERMGTLLAHCGESVWSTRIANDLARVRQGDRYAVERFLTYFGGMGSINDVWLARVNGHSLPPERERATNAEFQTLCARAWQLASAAVAGG